ncbi:MAG: DUF1513 domain-containing protein [Pseudomonadota bacterium]
MSRRLFSRRDFLKGAGLTFAASLSPAHAFALDNTDAVFASAYADADGRYGAAILSETGKIIAKIPLPARGHDVTHHTATGNAVVFARRPGTIAVAFDRQMRHPPREITASPGRHFYGHGVFSSDGRLLYASENDFDNAEGVIGVYDVGAAYRRVGEFPSGGTGPHDMLLIDNGRTLAIANGGIETHPDFGRAKLNISTMQPNLSFVDPENGSIVERQALPQTLHQLSIRHLADAGDGGVFFACQYEGAPQHTPALFGRARPGQPLKLFETERKRLVRFKNYIGSIAAEPQAGTVTVTSPRGGYLMVVDATNGTFVAEHGHLNVCGVAENGTSYLATTGNGVIFDTANRFIDTGDLRWDNHLTRL